MPEAVLFDLDDTLYDHLHSARHGLVMMSERHSAMQSVAIEELERRYSDALESIHVRLLQGEVTQREARIARMQQLFDSFGLSLDEETAIHEYSQFRRDYDDVCEGVAGSRELLDELKRRGTRLAIITNNLVNEQIPKLRQLDLLDYFEVVSISEEVGVPKPDRRIFDVTLDRLGLGPDSVVMVGDSLRSDIEGAVGVGIRAVWLQRRMSVNDVAPPEVAVIKDDFADTDKCVATILGNA